MDMQIKRASDCIFSLFLILMSLYLYYETYFFRDIFSFSFGPRIFPRIILILTMLCSLALLLQNISFSQEGNTTPEFNEKAKNATSILKIRVGIVALLVFYIICLPYVGYFSATVAFLMLSMLSLGVRTKKSILGYAIISVVITGALQFIFGTLLKFFLP